MSVWHSRQPLPWQIDHCSLGAIGYLRLTRLVPAARVICDLVRIGHGRFGIVTGVGEGQVLAPVASLSRLRRDFSSSSQTYWSNRSTLNRVSKPMIAKIPAATEWTAFIGTFAASLSPTKTAGTSASNMPKVVPMTTSSGLA